MYGMRRAVPLLVPLLLLASCSYEVSDPSVTLQGGDTKTVTILTYRYHIGTGPIPFYIHYMSSAPDVAEIIQDGTSPLVTIRALRAGTAFITPAEGDEVGRHLVTVTVFDCTVCGGYSASRNSLTVAAGQMATVSLAYVESSVYKPASYESSDEGVMSLDQVRQPNGTTLATVHGLHAGTATIRPAPGSPSGAPIDLVQVTVFECPPPVIIRPVQDVVEAHPGQPVLLGVVTAPPSSSELTWMDEATGVTVQQGPARTFSFTPRTSGTYHIRVEYTDVCGTVSTRITVIASTRPRAVRH